MAIATHNQFKDEFKKWLRHKFILSKASKAFKYPIYIAKANKLNEVFGAFLSDRVQYSAGQLAVLIKRHEDLLLAMMPVPQNPSFENSVEMFNQLIKISTEIIGQYNLHEHIKL